MIDLNKEREAFEALPQIKGVLIGGDFYFSTLSMNYKPKNPKNENHVNYTYFLNGAWYTWQEKAKTQAVPEGYVLVTEDQAKNTARLDFMLQEPRLVTTDINYDENYDKTGEGFCVNAVYWISGWDRLTETVHQTKREAIDEAINVVSESGAEG